MRTEDAGGHKFMGKIYEHLGNPDAQHLTSIQTNVQHGLSHLPDAVSDFSNDATASLSNIHLFISFFGFWWIVYINLNLFFLHNFSNLNFLLEKQTGKNFGLHREVVNTFLCRGELTFFSSAYRNFCDLHSIFYIINHEQ